MRVPAPYLPRSAKLHRRIRAGLLPAALLAALALASAGQALAQAAAPARKPQVQSIAYGPIPPGARFETQVNDDSELNQEALQRVNAALTGRGYAVAADADLVMVIESALVRGQKQDDPLGQVHADNQGAEVQARLFSTAQNSLLNPQQPIGPADRLYRINLSVYNRASGLYIWRGSATRSDPDIDVSQAGNEMVSELIAAIGKTVNPPAQPGQ
jgi:hypothetical protein